MLYAIVILQGGVEYVFLNVEAEPVSGEGSEGETTLCRIANNINLNYAEKATVKPVESLSKETRKRALSILALTPSQPVKG